MTECTYYVRAGFVPLVEDSQCQGRRPETAFATIGEAAAELTNPGDTVCIGPGIYLEGNIAPAGDGTTQTPIWLRADASGFLTGDAPGEVHIMPPPEPQPPSVGFLLLGRQNVVVDGFVVSGFADAGIQVRSAVTGTANSAGITIRGSEIKENRGQGIDVSAEGIILIEENCVIGNGQTGISVRSCVNAPPVGEEDPPPRCRAGPSGLVMPILSNNTVGDNGSHGMFFQDAANGLVQNNIISGNQETGVTLRSATDFQIINNLVYQNAEDGLAIGKGGAEAAVANAVVVNNTFYGNGEWGLEIGNQEAASPGATVLNNIFQGNGSARPGTPAGIGILNENVRHPSTCGYVAGFNINVDGYGPATPHNVYDIASDPLFVDPAAGDFRLQPGSPAIDAGSTTVREIRIEGATLEDGDGDTGIVDIGYHRGAAATQMVIVPTAFMPLYVRAEGDDGNGGKSPQDAFGSIARAASLAIAGVTVVVGPGRYAEADVGPVPGHGRVAFVADPSGARTGDRPGPVLVDVTGETGFRIIRSCYAVVDGFHVRNAADDGIQVRSGSDWAEVRNNVTYANRRGIKVVNANDVRVFNNLAYENRDLGCVAQNCLDPYGDCPCPGGGIQIGGICAEDCEVAGSRRTMIENNTCYGNGTNGLLIGAGGGSSRDATVRYNILMENGENGIQVGSNETRELHRPLTVARNMVDVYSDVTEKGEGDLMMLNPLFVAPESGDFHLRQLAAGELDQSRAVDHGDISAAAAGFSARTTRTDGVPDFGPVDLGYHYPGCRSTGIGDCNEDGNVSVAELILAVNVALGNVPVATCERVDANDDGNVSIGELMRSVLNALGRCV